MNNVESLVSSTRTPRGRKGLLRSALAAAAAIGCALAPLSASAEVADAPVGGFAFTLYQDAQCEGDWLGWSGTVAPNHVTIIDEPTLSLDDMNDEVSSWSFCNNGLIPAYFTVHFYADANDTGSSSQPVHNQMVSPGLCVTGNHMWKNDALTSLHVVVTSSPQG